MTQQFLGQIADTSQESGNDLAARLNAFDNAHRTNQSGATRPAGILAGGIWTRIAGGQTDLMVFDGAQDRVVMRGDQNLSGLTNKEAARTNLGLAGLATKDRAAIIADTTGVLSIARGGTGATTAAGVMTALGIDGIGLGRHNNLRGTWAEGTPADYFGKGFAAGIASNAALGLTGGGNALLIANGQWSSGAAGGVHSRIAYSSAGVFASRRDTDSTWTPWVQLDAQTLGEGQEWVDVTGSRSIGTSYQNTTGRTIMAAVRAPGEQTLEVSQTGTGGWVQVGQGVSTVRQTQYAIVPPDHYYRLGSSGAATATSWTELR